MNYIGTQQRYAMLTVDTEALPKRASQNHVSRLVWGVHSRGKAGIKQMSSIGNDFDVKHIFFIDLCGSYESIAEMLEAVSWLNRDNQDIQLHAHPEVLPNSFWDLHGISPFPKCMNEYIEDARAELVIGKFGDLLYKITHKDIVAFRAGSFRWNASLIRALKSTKFQLSFNNSMGAFQSGKCVYSEPTNYPYLWSNGIIEIPLTEHLVSNNFGSNKFWSSLTYPESPYFAFKLDPGVSFTPMNDKCPSFKVFLLHSWSLLDFDENGHAYYKDDQRLEGYRKLLSKLTKDYDVITTSDFIDLYERGKIPITRTVDISLAEVKR